MATNIASQLEELPAIDWNEFGLPGHDPLTGLPDRRLFELAAGSGVERAARERDDYLFAVCFIDLDGFQGDQRSFGAIWPGIRHSGRGCPAAGRLFAARRHGGAFRRRRVHGPRLTT